MVTLSLLLAIYGGSLDAAVWMPLGTWDTFSKASVSLHCLITDTLFTREEEGREGRREDERKPYLAALGVIIVIIIIGIAGTSNCLLLDCFSVSAPDPGYPNTKPFFPLK